jgi:hypothetical protein
MLRLISNPFSSNTFSKGRNPKQQPLPPSSPSPSSAPSAPPLQTVECQICICPSGHVNLFFGNFQLAMTPLDFSNYLELCRSAKVELDRMFELPSPKF